jgi:hypothetical protein
LKPAKPGEVRNPSGNNGFRPYTDAIVAQSAQRLPDHLRMALNLRFRLQIYQVLKDYEKAELKSLDDIPDLYPEKCTWAQANSVRQHLAAVLEGEIGASVELREAVEGRATTRVEFISQNDKLEELLTAFRLAAGADEAGVIEETTTIVAVLPSKNGGGNTDGQ